MWSDPGFRIYTPTQLQGVAGELQVFAWLLFLAATVMKRPPLRAEPEGSRFSSGSPEASHIWREPATPCDLRSVLRSNLQSVLGSVLPPPLARRHLGKAPAFPKFWKVLQLQAHVGGPSPPHLWWRFLTDPVLLDPDLFAPSSFSTSSSKTI